MKLIIATFFLTTVVLLTSCGQTNNQNDPAKSDSSSHMLSRYIIISDGCDGCDLMYQGMPSLAKLSNTTIIASPNESGERMEISGTIYRRDGKTPATNIILCVYHTDSRGYYSPSDTQTVAKRQGHLRGWIITNEKGQYKFETIRPAPYPRADIPAHIHPIVKEPGKIEYYLDEYVFDDDLKLTIEKKSKLENRGGSGIIHLTKNEKGYWIGRRDIILGLNIPNYK